MHVDAISITRPVKSNAVQQNAYNDMQTRLERNTEIQEYLRVQLNFSFQSNEGRTEGRVRSQKMGGSACIVIGYKLDNLRPTQPPTEWVPWVTQFGVKLSTHLP